MIEKNNNLYYEAPEVPREAVSFSVTDFGAYCARGFNPNLIESRIIGIAIKHFFSGEWLRVDNAGKSGSQFVFFDANNKELGRIYKPNMYSSAYNGKLFFRRTS